MAWKFGKDWEVKRKTRPSVEEQYRTFMHGMKDPDTINMILQHAKADGLSDEQIERLRKEFQK